MPESEIAPPTWKWQPLEPATYHRELTRAVHFSIKAVNTNAGILGVRLARSSGRRLPYVCLQRALADGHEFPLDYAANRGKVATVVKQAANVLGWDHAAVHQDVSKAERSAIQEAAAEATATDHIEGDQEAPISPRARQVLMPDANGGYIALVPLSAPVFAGFMTDKWRDWREAHDASGNSAGRRPRRLRQAQLGIGGANPQNAGRYIWRAQRPFVFFGPTEDPEIRRAYALYYRGVSLRLPVAPMNAYRQWRERVMPDGRMPTDMHLRRREHELIVQVVAALFARARRARELLTRHHTVLPRDRSSALVHPEVEPIAAGLTDPDVRARDWPKRFAAAIAHHIASYRFADGVELGLSSTAEAALARWIEDEVTDYEPL